MSACSTARLPGGASGAVSIAWGRGHSIHLRQTELSCHQDFGRVRARAGGVVSVHNLQDAGSSGVEVEDAHPASEGSTGALQSSSQCRPSMQPDAPCCARFPDSVACVPGAKGDCQPFRSSRGPGDPQESEARGELPSCLTLQVLPLHGLLLLHRLPSQRYSRDTCKGCAALGLRTQEGHTALCSAGDAGPHFMRWVVLSLSVRCAELLPSTWTCKSTSLWSPSQASGRPRRLQRFSW